MPKLGRLAALAILLVASRPAFASDAQMPAPSLVQFNASMVLLGTFAHDDRGFSGGGQVGFRPELIFGRRGPESLGAGPYLEAIGHFASRGVEGLFGGGGSLEIPLGSSSAIVPSVGAFTSASSALKLQPGLVASLYLGAKQFNPTSRFDGAYGLRLDLRYGLGSAHEAIAALGFQFDLSWFGALLSWAL